MEGTLGMGAANERWRYNVTSSLIGWAHIQNDPCDTGLFGCDNTRNTLGMGLTNEKWRYNVTSSLIGWAHNQNDPCDTLA